MTNPIDDPNFNPNGPREANVEMMAELRAQAIVWRASAETMNNNRARLNAKIIESRKAGHSYKQIRDATDLSVAAIQLVIAKAGL